MVWKVIFPVIALKTIVATAPGSDPLVRNATVAERLGILLVHALRVLAVMLATVAEVSAVSAAAARLATLAAA